MTSTRSFIATLAGFAALAFLFMALIYWTVFAGASFDLQSIDWTLRILVAAAVICFSIYIIILPESVGGSVGKRSTKLTANALVASLIAAGIAIALNLIVGGVPTVRADWTAGQDFSLSPQTKKILAELETRNSNVTAVAFIDTQQRQQAEDLFKEYASYSGRFRYEFVDAVSAPLRAAQYGVTRQGLVVFDAGNRREIAETASEREFTSALLRLGQNQVRTVAFVTGYGERDANAADVRGYSQIRQSLEQNNYRTVSINLITATLTLSDVSVLVIAEPTRAYGDREVQAVQTYLDAGGRVLMLLDPFMPKETLDPLRRILNKYGVTPVQGGVIDLSRALNPQNPTDIIVNSYPTNDITTEISRNNFATRFYLAMGINPPTSTVAGLVATPIIESSGPAPDSWLETAIQPNLTSQIELRYDEGTDISGPVTMAVSVGPEDLSATEQVTTTQPISTRLIVYGDSDWVSNGILSEQLNVVNTDLFGNSISWLAGANELVSIRPKEQSGPRTVLLDVTQKNLVFVVTVLGLPLLVSFFGFFSWWRRR